MRYWLGVVHRDHVRRGVDQGIAQLDHGSRAAIAKLSPGDGLVYYSPKDVYPDGKALQAFTAIGRVAEGEPWQAAPVAMLGKEVRPWRRRVEYVDGVAEAPIAPLLPVLELTRETPNWGWLMRRGTLEVTAHDFRIIAGQMGADSLFR
ncbi:EVE domain-containing protein [Pseudolysinimonas sp.]